MRRGCASDLLGLVALDARCFDRPWSESSWNTELGRDWVRVWILPGTKAQIAGYAVCWHLDAQAELLRIAVAPEQRGKGFGKVLLAHSLEAASALGCTSMSLEVQDGNDVAIGLYKSLGFEPVGKRPGYYAGKDGLLFLNKFAVT